MLTSRDKECFLWIWLLEYLSISQYTALLCPGVKNGNKVGSRRLNKLADEKYLNCFIGPNREHIFYLNKTRLDEIRQTLGDSIKNIIPKTTEPEDMRFINHHLHINTFIIYLHLACKNNSTYSFSFIPEWRSYKSGSGRILEKYIEESIPNPDNPQSDCLFTPDCLISIQNNLNKKQALLFLEADLGNTTLSSSTHNNDIAHKLKSYTTYMQGGFERYSKEFSFPFKGFRVLFPTTSEERANNILGYSTTDMAWVTTWDKLSGETIFNKIWKTRTLEGYVLKKIVTGDENE